MEKKSINGISHNRKMVHKIWMIMRLIVFLFFVSLFHVSASVYSQKARLNIKVENATLQQVFKAIQEQSEFDFFYKNEQIPSDTRVSINCENEVVEVILNNILKGTGLGYHVLDKDIVISTNVTLNEQQQPQKKVTGKVTDSSGASLPGVSVVIKGTTSGVVTDNDGNYSLTNIPENAILQFSFVGMKSQEILVGNKTNINVGLLEETIYVDEVVAIGYGTMRKSDLTGAIGVISGKKIENQAVSTVGQALQGKVAGLNIRQVSGNQGVGDEIQIRGKGTFGANASVLVVIDGIISNGGLTDIDPSVIEDVSVLKDATSAAIYGARGANGVLLITTKRGKVGKEVVNFNAYYSLDKVIQKIGTVDASTYEGITNDFYTNQGKAAPYANPLLAGKGTNWQDEIFRTGNKQTYTLSSSGGTEKYLRAITMSYYDGEGIVVNSKYSRVNFHFNNDIKPFEGLKIGSSLVFSYGVLKQGDSEGAVGAALCYSPNVKPYNENGIYGIATRAGQTTTMPQPLVLAYERTNKNIRLSMLGNLYAEYEIIPRLKFKTSIGVEYINMDTKNFVPSYNFGPGNSNGIATLNRNINTLVSG